MDTKNSLSPRAKRVLVLVAIMIVLAPCVVGVKLADNFVMAQQASCAMIESAVGQINPNQPTGQPQTAEQCAKAVELVKPMTYGIFIFIPYVFTIVLLGFLYAGFLIFVRR